MRQVVPRIACCLVLALTLTGVATADADSINQLVAEIRKADYAGDQAALDRLNGNSDIFLSTDKRTALVRYWRGFALWRKALNGFNDGTDRKVIEQNLTRAVDEFDKSLELDSDLVDSRIGQAACLMSILFLNQADQSKVKLLVPRFVKLLQQAEVAAPNNPRFYWVKGPQLWYLPTSLGGGEAPALAAYEKGLKLARHQKRVPKDSIEPTWGEPEILMNLAWSNLNKLSPDLVEAERYARQALKLVPKWHYVRDILLPQILKAKAEAQM